MYGERYYGINRYLCNVLEEMRKCIGTNNYSYLMDLTEEAESYTIIMANGIFNKLKERQDDEL